MQTVFRASQDFHYGTNRRCLACEARPQASFRGSDGRTIQHAPDYRAGFATDITLGITISVFHHIQKEHSLKTKSHLSLVVAAVAILISGCASTTRPNTSTSTIAQPATSIADMPALKISVDCGACTVKPNIPDLIAQGYNEAAIKAGRKISTTAEAKVTIKEYTARNDTARILAGAFAGKDEIKVVVAYQGKTYAVEDYYRNAWLGIENLARKIGEMSYTELK